MKQHLIDEISVFLLKKEYTLKNLKGSSFDVLARREGNILLLKVLEDANSVSKECAQELNDVAAYIDATPLIVAEKAGQKLEDNVVYLRFGVFTINFATLTSCVQDKFPFIKKTNAGLTASIIGKKIKNRRGQLGLSVNVMSRKLGVSGRMIAKYESGLSEVTLPKAARIYDIFGESVFDEINIFRRKEIPQSNAKSDVSRKYIDIGFTATDIKKAPFDVIAKKSRVIVVTEIGDKISPDSILVSKLIDADNLVIFEKKKPKNIAAIKKKDFLDFGQSDELIKFLKEF